MERGANGYNGCQGAATASTRSCHLRFRANQRARQERRGAVRLLTHERYKKGMQTLAYKKLTNITGPALLAQLEELHFPLTHVLVAHDVRDLPRVPTIEDAAVASALCKMDTFSTTELDLLSVRYLRTVLDDAAGRHQLLPSETRREDLAAFV